MNKKCPYCGETEFAEIDVIGRANEQHVQTGKDYFGRAQYKTEMVTSCSLLPYFFDDQCTEGHVRYKGFSNMHAEVCKNCGHIDFFADESILEAIHIEDDRVDTYNKAVAVAKKDVENKIKVINSIFDEIGKFTMLSKDESITVKQQKEYLANIEEKTNECKQLTKELDSYLKGLEADVKAAVEPLKETIKQ